VHALFVAIHVLVAFSTMMTALSTTTPIAMDNSAEAHDVGVDAHQVHDEQAHQTLLGTTKMATSLYGREQK